MMNPMLLSNVTVKVQNGNKEDYVIPTPLRDVVYALAMANPKWTLVGEGMGYEKNRMDRFNVYAEGQRVGGLKHDWSSRAGTHAVLVQADNIGNRKDHIITSDTKKAIREAQKHFIPKSLTKIMAEHVELANRVVDNQRYRKNSVVQDYMGRIRTEVHNFAFVAMRESFSKYLADSGKSKMLEDVDNSKQEVLVLDEILNKIKHSNSGVYIAIHKGGYLVKALDNVQHYTDTTLPEEYRAKLGMLKLVENEQCIEGVGCRATDSIFVITM